MYSFFFQEWTDEKMRWNPEEFDGIGILRVPCKLLWLPDIVLYNRWVCFMAIISKQSNITLHQSTLPKC